MPFHRVQRSSWRLLMFVSALVVVPLCSHHCCFSLFLRSSSSSYSSHISFPSHFLWCSSLCIPASPAALSTKVMHSGWSNSPLRHISRNIMLPLVISVGCVSDMSGEDSSQASFPRRWVLIHWWLVDYTPKKKKQGNSRTPLLTSEIKLSWITCYSKTVSLLLLLLLQTAWRPCSKVTLILSCLNLK